MSRARRLTICVAVLVFVLSVGGAAVALASTGKGAVVASVGSVRTATLGIAEDVPGSEWTDLNTSTMATFNGTLDLDIPSGYAGNDVLRMYFKAGEVVTFDLTADGQTTDFGLALWGPDMITVYADFDEALVDLAPSYYGGPEAYPLTIQSFRIPKSGFYYINAYTWFDDSGDPYNPYGEGGEGAYTLTATIEHVGTTVNINAIPTLDFFGAAQVFGNVVTRVPGGVTSGSVVLMASTDGVHFDPIDAQEVGAGGSFSFTAPENTVKMYYQVIYDGTEVYNPSTSSVSANMFAFLTNPTATRYGSRSYRMSGYLGSWHATGSSAVRVYIWRYVSGKWKSYGYRSAKVADSGVLSKFTASYKFPYTGKWRMQAYHSDANHATTRSGYVSFTVK